ncbi:MAG: homoserine O-succinyltransferase [gamma proteobacterium symbiont of Bathyaustriella thionipta]|nr:homoserine O-succinyltransferase [gamma proteobacterium symbiont of Bathyaustriella thionipta]
MPLVAHNELPTFARLHNQGETTVLSREKAKHQHIREQHIGLLNMMPDKALAATERQFFRLVGESNPIAQFYMHPFTLDELPRSEAAQQHIDQYYDRFEDLQRDGLDALIITGANVSGPELEKQPFWKPLIEVIDWAAENVTSTLCSCLATHAVMQFRYAQKRTHHSPKRWGIFEHQVIDKQHPLVFDINTRFDAPHSRWNDVSLQQFRQAGLRVLACSEEVGVHLASSADGLKFIFFQGHPEYDTISLLKEYKREVLLYASGNRSDYPPFPQRYIGETEKAILNEYRMRLDEALHKDQALPEFPEPLINQHLPNSWHDTAEALVSNWLGMVYQLTHQQRKLPLMPGIDPDDPLGLLAQDKPA